MVAFDDVLAARDRLRGVAHRTPVLRSRQLDEAVGASVFLKAENLQRAGAFKFRGAWNKVASLPAAERGRGLLAYSSGNHAQAVALAARLVGAPAVIVMPQDAPRAKVAATRGYGAEVVFYDRYREDREAVGERLAGERGMVLVPPFDDPLVIAGQGTVALELLEEVPDLDVLLAPCSGCGLLAGCAVAATHLRPGIRVYGVEPETANDTWQSLRRGERVTIPVPRTICDGLQTPAPGRLTFPIVQRLVADVLLVSDAEVVGALRFLLERLKVLVEPSGAAAAAAVLERRLPDPPARIGVVLSGGNLDLERLADLLRPA